MALLAAITQPLKEKQLNTTRNGDIGRSHIEEVSGNKESSWHPQAGCKVCKMKA